MSKHNLNDGKELRLPAVYIVWNNCNFLRIVLKTQIPSELTEEKLKNEFLRYGKIEKTVIIRKIRAGQPRSIIFVYFCNVDQYYC
jgi:RNA recognition motif-containing protein